MADDPLSTLLAHLDARAVCAGGLVAGGDWALAFPAPEKIKFFAVHRGRCWLTVGAGAPVRLDEGDVVLLSVRQRFGLASDPRAPAIEVDPKLVDSKATSLRVGLTEDVHMLGGHVDVDWAAGPLLVESLPPFLHVEAGSAEASSLQWLIGRLVAERTAGGTGADFACASIAQLIFLHILRDHLARSSELAPGWLRALGDARIAPALRLMHADPGRDWRLSELARAAAMSRTAFALHFKAVAGVAPLAWLTEWRMRLAAKSLRETDRPLALVAASVGYASESAFSTAFKRVTGNSPRRYRSTARPPPAGPADGQGEPLGAAL